MITVVETGGANINSLLSCLRRLNISYHIAQNIEDITHAEKIILPGVGYASYSMDRLNENQYSKAIQNFKNPVLGICLGMQILFESSEEGQCQCLGVLPGIVQKINVPELIVPHMGWNLTTSMKMNDLLKQSEYFYYVHSYIAPQNQTNLATCDYGIKIPAIVNQDNFFGVQFHPERSGQAGEKLLERFFKL